MDIKKVFIIDFYGKTEQKKNLLRSCIESVKKFGYDIILVGHCTVPEDIISSVNYYLYDSDNTFNNNHVFGYKFIDHIEIRKNIFKSHEYPIIRSMRLALNVAKSMGYEFFHFTEFDHVYSDNSINEIIRLESELINQNKDYLFFRPLNAVFHNLVGEYYESSFFSGYIDKFLIDFDSYFPKSLEEYNANFSFRLPNCLEHFFYELFKDKNSLIIEEYVKNYFNDSLINISSYQDTATDILLTDQDEPYLVISNYNNYQSKYELFINNNLFEEFFLISHTKLIKIPYSCDILIKRYNNDLLDETLELNYDEFNKEKYKINGIILNINKKMFDINYESNENKLTFTYTQDQPRKILISIKDIDSHACIYSFYSGDFKGCSIWAIPLPKHVFDFYNNPNFGGFLFEYYEDNKLIGSDKLRIKEIQTVKPLCDFSNTEPIFMNYVEFFQDKIYDSFDIHNLNVVFDVGANVGLWSQYILSRGAKKVYSFEPNKKALEHLYKNINDNERVTVIPFGLYSEKTTIPFYVSEVNSLISSTLQENGANPTPSYFVDTVTLDETISKYGIDKIDLLKLDIEGAEFSIFENISDETLSKIDSVLIEYHDFYFEDGQVKVQNIVDKLINSGFHITKPDNVKFIFGYKVKKNYWVDSGDNIEIRNLYDLGKTFSWEGMNNGSHNGYHHMYNELHFLKDDYTNGCVYERYGCKIEKGDIVVDIGANIGGFSNIAFEKGASKIYSFEPLDLSFNCLLKNKPNNCEVFKMAVSDHNGFDLISSPTKSDTMSASILKEGKESNLCPTITIDYLFEKGILQKIDFLKIDAEGSECKIIKGISSENLLKINKIAIELHVDLVSQDEIEYMLTKLNNSGFKSFKLYLGSEFLIIYNFWR